MGNFTLEENGSSQFLQYELAENEELDETGLNMIIGRRVEGFLPMTMIQVEGKRFLKYDFKNTVSLEDVLQNGLTENQELHLYKSICNVIQRGEGLFLETGMFNLNPNMMRFSQITREPQLLCLPLLPADNSGSNVKTLIRYMQHEFEEAPYRTQLLQKLDKNEDFSAKDFLEKLDEILWGQEKTTVTLQEETVAVPSVKKAEVPHLNESYRNAVAWQEPQKNVQYQQNTAEPEKDNHQPNYEGLRDFSAMPTPPDNRRDSGKSGGSLMDFIFGSKEDRENKKRQQEEEKEEKKRKQEEEKEEKRRKKEAEKAAKAQKKIQDKNRKAPIEEQEVQKTDLQEEQRSGNEDKRMRRRSQPKEEAGRFEQRLEKIPVQHEKIKQSKPKDEQHEGWEEIPKFPILGKENIPQQSKNVQKPKKNNLETPKPEKPLPSQPIQNEEQTFQSRRYAAFQIANLREKPMRIVWEEDDDATVLNQAVEDSDSTILNEAAVDEDSTVLTPSSSAKMMIPAVAVLTKEKTGEKFRVEKCCFCLGRSGKAKVKPDGTIEEGADCSFQTSDRGISRRHALLLYHDGNFYLQDISAIKETFVNGVSLKNGKDILNQTAPYRFTCAYPLQSGDVIRLRTEGFLFEVES